MLKNSFNELMKKGKLDVRLTAAQVQEQGRPVRWRRAMFCPNRINVVQNHNLNCTLCDSSGYLYDDDTEATEIKAVVTSIGLKQMQQSGGRYDAGMGIITAPPGTKLSWWDRIEFVSSTIRYTEPIQRSPAGLTDKTHYKVVSMVKVRDSSGERYLDKEDFIIVNGVLTWRVNRGPQPDTFYSVLYEAHPAYVILDLLHQIRDLPTKKVQTRRKDGLAEFPVQAVAKLDFLVERRHDKEEAP